MRESQLEKSFEGKIRISGAITFKFCSPNNPGVPDRIVITPQGKVVFVELKTETGRLSKIQEWQIKRLRDMGCDVRILRGMNEVNGFVREVIQ